MEGIDNDMMIEAVKKAKSPKQALDGAKMLYEGGPEYDKVFRACFEETWKDATRRNRAIERSGGKLADTMWKTRLHLDEHQIQERVDKILKSKDSTEWGKVLSEVDDEGIRQIFQLVKTSRSAQT